MRTISIIGTDFRGPEHRVSVRPDGTVHPWRRQPFADGGRLQLDRTRVEDWRNIFYELCDLARLPCLAIGIRGAYTDYDTNWRAPALDAYQTASPQPTLMPWFDTVGLPDMVNVPNSGEYHFDFANPAHIEIGWHKYARVFFDAFAQCTLEKSPNGKVLCAWWGIASDTGHGFRNQPHAQRLLDYIDQQCAVLGLGGADHIVDHTWLELCPGLQVFAVHDWFEGWGSIDPPRPPTPYTIRNHNGVTVGVAVPSFYDRINPDGNADTIRAALAAFRAAKVDYILIESGTNFQEDAELMRDASGNTHKLDAVREHIELLTPPAIKPVVTVEDDMKATFVISQHESFDHPTQPGARVTWHPRGQRETVLSVQGNGDISTRLLHAPPAPPGVPFDYKVHGLGGVPGLWETWAPDGNPSRAVFDVAGYTFAIPLVD